MRLCNRNTQGAPGRTDYINKRRACGETRFKLGPLDQITSETRNYKCYDTLGSDGFDFRASRRRNGLRANKSGHHKFFNVLFCSEAEA